MAPGVCAGGLCEKLPGMMMNTLFGLSYMTPKYMRVNIWWIGLIYYGLCIAVGVFVCWRIWVEGSYSYHEIPIGSINAWSEGFTPHGLSLTLAAGGLSYCSSADHDYVYSHPNWRYRSPACRVMSTDEVVTKGTGAVSVTTSIIETTSYMWPCAATDAASAAKVAACAEMGFSADPASGESSVAISGAQCGCERRVTYYVQGTEEIEIAFEHSYQTGPKIGLAGTSNAIECTPSLTSSCTDRPLESALHKPTLMRRLEPNVDVTLTTSNLH